MRRRWHIPEAFLLALGAIWVVGWIPGFIIVVVATGTENNVGLAGNLFLAAWFGAVLVPAFGYGLWVLWHSRPRRRLEPVVEDLRERG